ncbi:heavy metal translocating P-type ATPase [Sanyastnella coralliicola]|uniref:heavy metal translocating P-type ATPase n=1 Tax=Sanyastnella coralliicola TaxID=3069118 RepID=UPI0027B93EBB|nr:HAD-IC family P-type ATPase [Longitalea sp. SCSIO 12813]
MTKQAPVLECVHCGKDAPSPVLKGNDVYCCNGCLRVHELIHGIDDECTIPEVDESIDATNFSYLDLEDYRSRYLKMNADGTSTAVFFLADINCASCVQFLEQLHLKHEGILRSEVNYPRKELRVLFKEDTLAPSALATLLARVGYPPEIRQEKKDASKKRSRKLVTQIGVAGFCFGNIMLFSFPEYLGGEAVEEKFKRWFMILNFLLAFPVILYSGRAYLVSAWTAIRNRTVNIDVPVSIGMLAIFFRSSIEVLTNSGAGYFDSLAGLVFFLLIGKWYQARTYGALSYDRDYKSYFPIAVQRNTEDEAFVPISDLEIGDEIIIHHKEIIPADSILLSERARIDYSFVTGESEPIIVNQGEAIQAGGRQMGASITLAVSKEVEQSKLTRLWNSETFQKDQKSSIEDPVNRISKHFTWIVLTIAIGAFAYWYPINESIAWNALTATLIVACPCALALTLPFTLGSTMRLMGKAGLYLKNTRVIERMGKLKHLVFDKTGTLTRANDYQIEWHGDNLSDYQRSLVLTLVDQSAHPLSRALSKQFKDSRLRASLFIEYEGKGIECQIDQHHIQVGSASWLKVPMADLSGSQVHVMIDGEHLGCFSFDKPIRQGLETELKTLRTSFNIHLLSGDNASEAPRYSPFFNKGQMHFEQTPEGKMEFVQSLHSDEAYVAMVGDGLNDAGALKAADMGIAVVDDLYAFSPACDAILHAGALNQFHNFLEYAQKAMRTVRWSFVISFVYNAIGIAFAIQGLLTPLVAAILMPASSVTVVLFTVFSSHLHFRKLRQ